MSKQYEVYFFKKSKIESEETTEAPKVVSGSESDPMLTIEIGFFDKAITSPLIDYVDANITPVNCIDDVFLDKKELKKILDHVKTIDTDNSIKDFLEHTLSTFNFEKYTLIFRAW